VKFIPPACDPDCLLTFAHVSHAFRSFTNEQWAELVGSGVFDDFLGLIPAPSLPIRFLRVLMSISKN